MNTTPISIIIPVFNGEKFLAGCLDSIVNQTIPPLEVLLLDGGSTDATSGIAKAYSQKHSFIKFSSEKDCGIYDAMNKGIGKAVGDWLYFLGVDDRLFNPFVLETLFQMNKGAVAWADLIYGNVLLGNSVENYSGEFSRAELVERNICHQAIFYKRELFKRKGQYELNYKALADWKFNLRCFFDMEVKIKHVQFIVAEFSNEGMSRTANDPFVMEKNEFCRSLISGLPLYERVKVKCELSNGRSNGSMYRASYGRIILFGILFTLRSLRTKNISS